MAAASIAGAAALSEAERTYIVHGVQDGLREDGRACDDYRHVMLETGLLSNAHGSCRLSLGNTDVLVGIKADLDEPLDTATHEGRLEFFVDLSANAAPAFEGRGGDEFALEISQSLATAYKGQIDLKALCLVPRQNCWVLHVDVLLLQCGGNLLDAVSIATKAALLITQLPRVTIVTSEQGLQELEICDDPYDTVAVEAAEAPLLVTVNKVGQSHLVDATPFEEACTLAKLYIGVTPSGAVTYSRLGGGGSLHPDSVTEMLESGRRVGVALNTTLNSTLEQERLNRSQPVGFLKSVVS